MTTLVTLALSAAEGDSSDLANSVSTGPAAQLLPASIIAAILTFILSNIAAWVIRSNDRRRIRREERLAAVVQLLSACRRLINANFHLGKAWSERSSAEDDVHAAFVLLKSRAQHGQGSALLWIENVIQAIQYDHAWQDPEEFQTIIADPLFAWVRDPNIAAWFAEQNARESFSPVVFDISSIPAPPTFRQLLISWSGRNVLL